MRAVRGGTGLVSFDPAMPGGRRRGDPARATAIRIASRPHFVTALHPRGEDIPLLGPLCVRPVAPGTALALAGRAPLVTASRCGSGRVVTWATATWASSRVLGPVGGLDDLLWRSIVWAARKPFAIRALPPVVAMRVDDVAGRGRVWGRPPLYWVGEARAAGFKPWLGLFIYNLAPDAVVELKGHLRRGAATAFPHAFGRHPVGPNRAFFYWASAPRFPARGMDEFIFYDHERARSWPDPEATGRLRAVDDWYAAHPGLPKSRCFIPHWYETGENAIRHVVDRWGSDLSGIVIRPGTSYVRPTPMLKGGPYRRYETADRRRPVYYADFVEAGGRRLFNCVTEIRDIGGYEWAPDNDLEATVARGVGQLKRALDSLVPAVLFTHETDYICHMRPETFRAAVRAVARGVAGYGPEFETLDEAAGRVRATVTSRLVECRHDPGTGRLRVAFSGSAGAPTEIRVFTGRDDGINCRRVRIPPFRAGAEFGVGR